MHHLNACPLPHACLQDLYHSSGRKCYTFLYTYYGAAGNKADIDDIVANIKSRNTPAIPDDKVRLLAVARCAAHAAAGLAFWCFAKHRYVPTRRRLLPYNVACHAALVCMTAQRRH